MALTVSLTPFAVNLTTGVATVTDATAGYGTRSNYGVFVKAYKLDYTGLASAIPTTGNNSNPASDTIWSWTYSYSDGWYQLWYLAAPLYAGGTTYAQYDISYDPATKLAYSSIAGGNLGHTPNSSPSFWTALSDPTAVLLNIGTSSQPGNIVTNTGYATVNTILFDQTKYNYNYLCGQASLEPCTDCKRTWDVTQVQFLGMLMRGITNASQLQDYSNGEKIARRAITVAAISAF